MKTTTAKIRFPFRKKFHVRENHKGFLFKNGVLVNVLEPGNYSFWGLKTDMVSVQVPVNGHFPFFDVKFMTRDFIEMEIHIWVAYAIRQMARAYETLLDVCPFSETFSVRNDRVRNYFYKLSQVFIKEKDFFTAYQKLQEFFSNLATLNINGPEAELVAEFKEILSSMGVELTSFHWHIKLPKKVENLFHQMLEKKVRAEAELESARAMVAAARALKNASDIIKGDENILFLRYLETVVKIAEKGRHTFVMPSSLPDGNIKKNP